MTVHSCSFSTFLIRHQYFNCWIMYIRLLGSLILHRIPRICHCNTYIVTWSPMMQWDVCRCTVIIFSSKHTPCYRNRIHTLVINASSYHQFHAIFHFLNLAIFFIKVLRFNHDHRKVCRVIIASQWVKNLMTRTSENGINSAADLENFC